MSEISDHYRTVARGFTERVEAVPAPSWESEAPCEGWTARDVVQHVVQGSSRFFQLVDLPVPSGPPVEEDPVGSWVATREAIQAALDDKAVAELEYDSQMMGKSTFEKGVDTFAIFDLFVHTWDLARAAGLDERLDPDELTAMFERVGPMDEMLRSPGVCGPKLDPPPGADEQTRFLAFLGRRA